MLITSIKLKKDGNSARTDAQGKRYYTLVWLVVTDDPYVGAGSVRNAVPVRVGMPYVGAAESDTGSFCQSVDAKCVSEDGKQWEVTAEYGPFDASQIPENPLDRDPEMSWEYQQFQLAAEYDNDGNPILNSAGDRFDPPLLKDFRRPLLKLVRNEATFDPGAAYQYHDKVNSVDFWGAGPGLVKVEAITPQRILNNDIGWYYTVTYEFLFDELTWDPKILNQGFRALDPADASKIIECTDEYGNKVSSPVLLDKNGHQLPPNSKPTFLQFQIYERLDFGVFGFDAFYQNLVNYSGSDNGFAGI